MGYLFLWKMEIINKKHALLRLFLILANNMQLVAYIKMLRAIQLKKTKRTGENFPFDNYNF